MMSQRSHTKAITQINSTIESHKRGHEWDDVIHKIQKAWLLGTDRNMIDGKRKIHMITTDLLGNFMNNAFWCSRATQVTGFYPKFKNPSGLVLM